MGTEIQFGKMESSRDGWWGPRGGGGAVCVWLPYICALSPSRPQCRPAYPPGQHPAVQEVHQRLPLEPGGHGLVAGSLKATSAHSTNQPWWGVGASVVR